MRVQHGYGTSHKQTLFLKLKYLIIQKKKIKGKLGEKTIV